MALRPYNELYYKQVQLETILLSLILQNAQLQSSKTSVQLFWDFISVFDQILMLFFTHLKVNVPFLWAGHILQASLWEWVSTQKLPSASVGQFAQLTQSLEVFCTLLQAEVHQTHKTCQLSQSQEYINYGKIHIVSPEILTLFYDKPHYPSEIAEMDRGMWRGEVWGVCVKDTLEDSKCFPTNTCYYFNDIGQE